MLDRGILKELGITVLGDALAILQLAKGTPPSGLVCAKLPAAKLPELHLEITKQHFRKFEVDWNVFTQMTHLPTPQYNVQLYSCADSEVQSAIINTYPDWFKCDASKLIKMLQGIVTQKSNPMVHRMGFGNLSQAETETIQSYVVRLRAKAQDCNFSFNFRLPARHFGKLHLGPVCTWSSEQDAPDRPPR